MNHNSGVLGADLDRTERLKFGQRIHSLRKSRRWTLEQLGQRSNLAFSTISKAERGRVSLTYDNILKLAFAFDMDMSELLASAPINANSEDVTIERNGTAQRIDNDHYIMDMLCSSRSKKRMMPVFATIKAHSIHEFAKLISHPGEEFVYVLEGQLTFQVERRPPQILEQGDCLYFDSTLGHAYLSTSRSEAKLIVVCWHPNSSDVEDAGLRSRMTEV